MKCASQQKTILRTLKEFFKISVKVDSLEELASYISIGDNTIEYITLRLIEDKMLNNKYFTLSAKSYEDCKKQSSKLIN